MISYKIFCDTDELRKLSSEYMKVVRMSFNIFKKNPGCKLSYVEQELNARARQKLAGKRVQILPLDKLTSSMIPTLWKEMVLASSLATGVFSFKELFDLVNKTKLSYRFRYDRDSVISFKLESSKSLVRLAKL